ncbi:YdeI/OmpD-associated family protein [Paenibacillus tuaregi]|uniref:YdeI/OmpD-associated family protein n=1 Tax=Paenibacillus tuaregi TaxID=1816681 RepID=UPI000838C73B|nr:YdeI/OmpD-associated family protein [Paenibacillus tuaregi]
MNEQLARKLRLPESGAVLILNPPDQYLQELGLSNEVTRVQEEPAVYDFVQVFVRSIQEVEELAPTAIRGVKEDGLLWFCYMKGGAKAGTDLNRDKGWDVVTGSGYEGVSLVSIDERWSAMRYRPAREKDSAPRRSGARPKTGRSDSGTAALPVPEDLQQRLNESPKAAGFFAALAPSHRKAYLQWIEEAKRPETREARIVKTVEKLALNLKRPSDKEA